MNPIDDAIRWKIPAPRLLEVVPKAWIEEATEKVVKDIRSGRKYHRTPEISSFHPFIRDGESVNPGMSIITTCGAARYHTDASYPRFFYLLILHSRSYCVDGGMWPEPFEADQPGDLVCLDAHMEHGLRAQWSAGPQDLEYDACRLDRVLPRFWMALSMESWALLTPEQAIAAYDRGLRHNRSLFDLNALPPALETA